MTQAGTCARKAFSDHPCFYGSAKARHGRVHLPVAPDCNIQCNFCNRLYDCANESRPAVTKGILEPDNVVPYLEFLLRRRQDISVVGIAGPGDSLCDPERTLKTLRAVHTAYPHLLICISTNGLNLAEHVNDLIEAGVTHVTVTVNAVDPLIGQRIYAHVSADGRMYHGIEASTLLISRQKEAIRKLKARNLVVKVNTVVIPGVNADHVAVVAEEAANLGVDVMNCIPMIPVEGTPFEQLGAPTDDEMNLIRNFASNYIPQMYHCRKCRSDAAGLICEEDESNLKKQTIRFERFTKQTPGFAGGV